MKRDTVDRQCGEMIGRKFNNLAVIERAGTSKHGRPMWLCHCDCGNTTIVPDSNLKAGGTKSCGCYKREMDAARSQDGKKSKYRRTGPKPSLTPEERKERKRAHVRRRMAERYADPVIRMHMLIARRLRKTLQQIGERKTARTFEMLGYDTDALECHLERQFTTGMSWENMGKWHIDHIVPISTAKTQGDIVRLNQLPNLRPLWARDNMVKSCKREFLL